MPWLEFTNEDLRRFLHDYYAGDKWNSFGVCTREVLKWGAICTLLSPSFKPKVHVRWDVGNIINTFGCTREQMK